MCVVSTGAGSTGCIEAVSAPFEYPCLRQKCWQTVSLSVAIKDKSCEGGGVIVGGLEVGPGEAIGILTMSATSRTSGSLLSAYFTSSRKSSASCRPVNDFQPDESPTPRAL